MLSALKNFGITFLISALLFGIIAYFAVGFVTNTVTDILDEDKTELEQIMQSGDSEPKGELVEKPQTDENLPVPEGNSFSFLLLTTDYRPELYNDYYPTLETMNTVDWNDVDPTKTVGCLNAAYRESRLTSIVLVRVDKEKRQYVYSYFSPEMRVYTSTGNHSMAEVYNIYGKQIVADHLTAMTGLKIKYTFLLNGYNFDELTDVLGVETVNNKRALYLDENGVTTQMETLVERIGDDGYPWTEHIPNAFLIGEGEIEADAETLFTLLSIEEKSVADRDAKASETIELVRKYLNKMADMDRSQLKLLLSQLITREEEWINIEGYIPPEKPVEEIPSETAEEGSAESGEEAAAGEIGEEAPAINDDVPFDTTPMTEEKQEVQIDPETGEPIEPEEGEDGEKEEEKEEEEPKLWIMPLGEPATAILETNFTMNDFDSLYELLEALKYFESVRVDYPAEFREATADNPAYFDPDLEAGLEVFRQYRQIVKTEQN